MLEGLLEKLLAEVQPAPCGKDPSDHPLYEAISDQRNRGGPFSGAADWNKTQNLCLELLSGVAKELGVMNTLVVALANLHGVEGLCVGIEAETAFCKAYWEDMHPPKSDTKRRVKAMRWLNDRIKDIVRGDQLATTDRGLLERTEKAIADLHESMLAMDAGKAIPSLGDLKEWIQTTLIKLPKAAPPPVAVKPVAPAPAAANPQPQVQAPLTVAPQQPIAAAQPLEIMQAPADDASVDEQLGVLAKIAANLFAQAPQMALAYRLLRIAKWQNAKLPPHEANGETRIPAPNEQIVTSLKTMAQRQAWMDLLNRCEDLTQRVPLWLDLQYFSAQAASSLGTGFAEVLEVVEAETAVLFKRIPKLAALKFNDGTPLASNAAVAWLEGLASKTAGGGGGTIDKATELRAELLKLGEAKFEEALTLAQKEIDGAGSPLEALKMKLEAAAFALSAGQQALALSMLKGLCQAVREAKLDAWEPKWAARVWAETVKACRALELKINDDLEAEALVRLSSLDLKLFASLKK